MPVEDIHSTEDAGIDRLADRLGSLNTEERHPKTEEEYAQAQLTLRAIVTSKEAGVIIGKAGQNVADLRDQTGVRAGVSKVVPGVHDRVLSVTGSLRNIAEAYGLVADGLVKGAPQMGMGGIVANPNTHRQCLIQLLYTTNSSSYPPPRLTQSDGYHHRSSRCQNQADSGRLWCTHGGPERNAPTIDRAYC